jgi:hypothetical protein
MVMLMLLLSGCQQEADLYDYVRNQTSSLTDTNEAMKENSVVYLTEKAYDFSRKAQVTWPFICIGSWVVWLWIWKVVQQDLAIRKRALVLFGIGIPALDTLLTWGLSWLIGATL